MAPPAIGYRPVPGEPDAAGTVDVPAGWLDLLTEHRQLLLVAGLAVCVLLLALTIRRAIKGGRPDRWVDAFALLVGFGWSAEGMWEVATGRLHLAYLFAVVAFTVFEAFMASSMLRANRHQKEFGNPGRHGRAAWLIAGLAGCIVALAADSLVEVPLRLAIPLLVVFQWWLGLTADGLTKDRDAITWRWTPRRILLLLGVIEPGERDVIEVDRERRIAQMTTVAHRLHHGSKRFRGLRAGRLRRLALAADDSMVAEVQARVERVNRVEEATRPGAVQPSSASWWIRQQTPALSGRVMSLPQVAALATRATVAPPAVSGGETGGALVAKVNGHPVANAVAKIPPAGSATPAASASPRRSPRKPDPDAVKVAKLVAKNKDITAAQVAKATGMSHRTASRHLTDIRPKRTTPTGDPS